MSLAPASVDILLGGLGSVCLMVLARCPAINSEQVQSKGPKKLNTLEETLRLCERRCSVEVACSGGNSEGTVPQTRNGQQERGGME